MLANYARAIRHVHDETVKLTNQGLPLWEIRERVKLPADLAELEYLQPGYGSVAWSVNGIYRQYTGWYDFNPAHLNDRGPVPAARAVVEASGADPLRRRAAKAMAEGDLQLTIELTDLLVTADPADKASHRIRAEAMEQRAKKAFNTVERNVYLLAAQESRRASQ
jgi:alkyl sulfatase BDS1-like metallo-beta-lactamase superfamily hydrolase